MKNAIKTTVFLSLMIVGLGCGPDLTASRPVSVHAQDTDHVTLLYAKAAIDRRGETYPSSTSQGYLYGYVEVSNLAYEKNVTVHYNVRKTDTWHNLPASYVGQAAGNREVWGFTTPSYDFPARLSVDFHFAIRYDVAGETYWDNNSSQDYKVGVGPRPIYPRVVLQKSPFVLGWTEAYGEQWRGNIVVKNLAYHKQANIVFSTDGWLNTHQVATRYFNSSAGDNLENWGFQSQLPVDTQQIEFAINYQVNGETYWDNNFGANYRLQVPGRLE